MDGFLSEEKNLTDKQRAAIYGMITAAFDSGFEEGLRCGPAMERVKKAGKAFGKMRDERILQLIQEGSKS